MHPSRFSVRSWPAFALAAGLSLGLVSAARGADVVIDFNSLPSSGYPGVRFANTNTWSVAVSGYQFKTSDTWLNIANWGPSPALFKEEWRPEPVQMRRQDGGPFFLKSFSMASGWAYPVTTTVRGYNASGLPVFTESFGPFGAVTTCNVVANNVPVVRVEWSSPITTDWPGFDNITVDAAPQPPVIGTQPGSVTLTAGGQVVLTVSATGTGTLTYQWKRGGVAIPGATGSSLTIPSTQSFHAGSYTCDVTDDNGTATTNPADVTVDPPAPSTAALNNISTRGYVGTGDSIMIPGIVVVGEGSKTFLIRAVGPSLHGLVTGELADPMLRIYGQAPAGEEDAPLLLTNDNWGENADATLVRDTAAAVGAFPLTETSADAAFVVTLPAGIYTVHASGVGGTTGIAIVEVYLVP